jgi:hypothetical protein
VSNEHSFSGRSQPGLHHLSDPLHEGIKTKLQVGGLLSSLHDELTHSSKTGVSLIDLFAVSEQELVHQKQEFLALQKQARQLHDLVGFYEVATALSVSLLEALAEEYPDELLPEHDPDDHSMGPLQRIRSYLNETFRHEPLLYYSKVERGKKLWEEIEKWEEENIGSEELSPGAADIATDKNTFEVLAQFNLSS